MESNNLVSGGKSEKKQIKSFVKYENIKADYFLLKVFDNLKRNKSLTIIKHNKKIQNKLDINKNTYKEYIYIYSQIILEIIPSKNEYGKFINIQKK